MHSLVKAARRFLVDVSARSGELDPDSDGLTPDLVIPDHDEWAMWEAMAALPDDDQRVTNASGRSAAPLRSGR
ncbi:hypothetical protein OIE71_33035 [Streptomyces sp. NBC_01725]|uniref:hypothetical protein n=1 Tax=Streptomyces sp. NBC_01725 TaxID=2975923 RepID=UPI002E2BF421|nr:hypothetical protein [Streptomyces sp. NBC_01725]